MTKSRHSPRNTTNQRSAMKSLRHTHPNHDTRDWHWFRRGPTVAADGGRREAEDDEDTADEMRDVSHTRDDDAHANRVWDGTRVHETDDE